MKRLTLAVCAAFLSLSAFAESNSFVPENDLYIGLQKSRGGITEREFTKILKTLGRMYSKEAEALGFELQMNNQWKDGTVNASTNRNNKTMVVNAYGGLARAPGMTYDGYAMIICHELGHQFGGAPYKTMFWGIKTWAAAEGQSDYFAGAKCMKRFYAELGVDENIVNTTALDDEVIRKCEMVYGNSPERDYCLKIAETAEVVGNVLNFIAQSDKKVSLLTPETFEVDETNTSGYPSNQCRVDTFFQGALCDKDPMGSEYCTEEEGYELGRRPACWF